MFGVNCKNVKKMMFGMLELVLFFQGQKQRGKEIIGRKIIRQKYGRI
jgi:hypothetical protein